MAQHARSIRLRSHKDEPTVQTRRMPGAPAQHGLPRPARPALHACTHQGCTVSDVREDGIFCKCHGSLFALRDGTPVQGPATDPLVRATLTESGTDLIVAA